MKKYEISENVLQAVLSYLSTQPYQSVAQLIAIISKEMQPEPVKKVEEKK